MNHKTSENQAFSTQIISWYRANPRELPWRGIDDPYKIWLSEIILQQTRVAQGLPYYYAFSETYPTVKDLALAPDSEVLRLWQGLGYYSRARNLHSCAKYIWHELDGKFPANYRDLLLLKGVGSYTAAAIASFAYGEAKAVVDGNVFRVLARYFGIETDIATGKAKKQFEALADQLIPYSNPGEFNQAMMDFGARLCVPKNPECEKCPLMSSCFAYQKGLVKELPVKINKTKSGSEICIISLFSVARIMFGINEKPEISGKAFMISQWKKKTEANLLDLFSLHPKSQSLCQKITGTFYRIRNLMRVFQNSISQQKSIPNCRNGVKMRAIFWFQKMKLSIWLSLN